MDDDQVEERISESDEDVRCAQESRAAVSVAAAEIPVTRRGGDHARALLPGAGEPHLDFDKTGVSVTS